MNDWARGRAKYMLAKAREEHDQLRVQDQVNQELVKPTDWPWRMPEAQEQPQAAGQSAYQQHMLAKAREEQVAQDNRKLAEALMEHTQRQDKAVSALEQHVHLSQGRRAVVPQTQVRMKQEHEILTYVDAQGVQRLVDGDRAIPGPPRRGETYYPKPERKPLTKTQRERHLYASAGLILLSYLHGLAAAITPVSSVAWFCIAVAVPTGLLGLVAGMRATR